MAFNTWFMLSLEPEEEHNWVFSADQMEDEAAGTGY